MNNNPIQILHEITPLGEHDFMYVADRHKKEFSYPLHCHDMLELNFVENATGGERIIGDSVETIGEYDLVLITSPELEHVWNQGKCTSEDIHEITIQFALDFQTNPIFQTNPFASLTKMLVRAQKGLCFSMHSIMQVYPRLMGLSNIKEGFYGVIELLSILYELSLAEDARELASTTFAKVDISSESRRVLKVKNYISTHFTEELRLEQLSNLVGMTPSAFSRFFKLRTGKNLAEFIVDTRLGHATRKLIDTTSSVAEIGFECGFNTLSNFNRLFKKRKGCSPTAFREKYCKTRVIL